MSTIDTTITNAPDEPVETINGPVGLRRDDGMSDATWRYRVEHTIGQRDSLAAGMRDLVDLVASRDLVWPDSVQAWAWRDKVTVEWIAPDEQTFRELRKAVGSTLSSPWVKATDYGKASVSRDASTFLHVKITAGWGTCEQVEVGTRTVERSVEVCPTCESDLVELDNGGKACEDDLCAYEVVPAKRVRRELVEPELEWRCPDLADL